MKTTNIIRGAALVVLLCLTVFGGMACSTDDSKYPGNIYTNPTDPSARNFENPETSVVEANFVFVTSSDPDNLTVIFTNTSTGNIDSYTWNFGDGRKSTAENPVHTYRSAGSYVVTLTVTDDDGATNSDTVMVTVREPDTTAPDPVTNLTGGVTGVEVSVLRKRTPFELHPG